MTANANPNADIPSEWLPRFQEICNDFANAWENNQSPSIASHLDKIENEEARPSLLGVLIALEVRLKEASGETLLLSSYLDRFPDFHDQVRLGFRHANKSLTVSLDPDSDSDSDPKKKLTFDELPSRVGRYEILSKLGEGGFGLVCLAQDTTLDRKVALKFAQHTSFDSREHLSAFIREARIVASLVHASIVTIYDIQRFDDMLCIVQQYIAGNDLREELLGGTPTFRRTAEVCAAIAEGIGFAHQHGFFHRDIKPANILIDRQGNPLIADFGLAIHESAQRRRRGERTGTPRYMPPELVLGETHRIDGRSDIWSLGVMMYEMLTGSRAFRGETLDDIFDEIQHRNPIPPRQLQPEIPLELERICLKCLSKRVIDRFTSAGDLAEDLKSWLATSRPDGAAHEPALTSDLLGPQETVQASVTHGAPPARLTGAAGKVIIVPRGLRSFDSHDADFFLHLLPGPHDRIGMPESIRFWRNQIENPAAETPHSVGLIYGPSGCGKSSFVKAGLIPVLSDNIIPVYIEATSQETEGRLVAAIERAVPEIDESLDLVTLLDSLRDGNWLPRDRKLLIIIDQFEQWLHSHNASELSELARAIRQCDGNRISCLLMVRDDFWLATSRFMRTIEIDLLEGKNATLIDLFDKPHARRVLTKYGQAYQALPEDLNQLTKAQSDFIASVVNGIAEQDKVICVRLATFAEMFKDKPWTTTELARVGGPQGVGRKFLEDTFESRLATPEHRLHKAAARKFLEALLPEIGTGIRGNMRSASELQKLVGYESRPQDFADLTRILDQELRLVTLTDPLGLLGDRNSQQGPQGDAHFQLAHDFLVQPLRDWLTEVRQATMRGRAQLRLKKRCATWAQNPTKEYLPGMLESANILTLTPSAQWSEEESRMMRQASWMHGLRIVMVTLLLVVGGWMTSVYLANQRAHNLVARLLEAETLDVPPIINLIRESPRAQQLVAKLENDDSLVGDRQKQLHLQLARYVTDPTEANQLADIIVDATASEVRTIAQLLEPDKERFVDTFWARIKSSDEPRGKKIRMAATLAAWVPDENRWAPNARLILDALLDDQIRANDWMKQLEPVKRILVPKLMELGAEGKHDLNFIRGLAQTNCEPSAIRAIIDEVLLKYDPKESNFLKRWRNTTRDYDFDGTELNGDEFKQREADQQAYVQLCRRVANLVAIQLACGDGRMTTWQMLRCDNLTIRSLLIERLFAAGYSEDDIFQNLEERKDPETDSALILALGPYLQERPQLRSRIEKKIRPLFTKDPSPLIHSACEWLLKQVDKSLVDAKLYRNLQAPANGNWRVTKTGMSLVKVKAVQGKTFADGRPEGTHGVPTRFDFSNDFWVSSKEITLGQFRTFAEQNRDQLGNVDEFFKNFESLKDEDDTKRLLEDQPSVRITWSQMAAFCNWLSLQDGIDKEEWCFEVDPDFDKSFPPYMAMRLKENWETKRGYRLPTQFEWQLACDAETLTSWCCGSDKEVLKRYSWYEVNTLGNRKQARRVALMKPNRLGIFDMHGNVDEFTVTNSIVQDVPGKQPTKLKKGGLLFASANELTCSKNLHSARSSLSHMTGFRIVRIAD